MHTIPSSDVGGGSEPLDQEGKQPIVYSVYVVLDEFAQL